jgi:hypothetical protein
MTLTYRLSDANWQRMVTAIVAVNTRGGSLQGLAPAEFAKAWIINQAIGLTRQFEQSEAAKAAVSGLPAPVDIPIT